MASVSDLQRWKRFTLTKNSSRKQNIKNVLWKKTQEYSWERQLIELINLIFIQRHSQILLVSLDNLRIVIFLQYLAPAGTLV